ncbi:hypothetical protein Nmel_017714 [Mimus melanotis]
MGGSIARTGHPTEHHAHKLGELSGRGVWHQSAAAE